MIVLQWVTAVTEDSGPPSGRAWVAKRDELPTSPVSHVLPQHSKKHNSQPATISPPSLFCGAETRMAVWTRVGEKCPASKSHPAGATHFSTGCQGGVKSGRDNGPLAISEDRWRGYRKMRLVVRNCSSDEWPKFLLLQGNTGDFANASNKMVRFTPQNRRCHPRRSDADRFQFGCHSFSNCRLSVGLARSPTSCGLS